MILADRKFLCMAKILSHKNSYNEHVDNDEQDQYCSGLILENTRSIKMAPNELRKTRKII